jgi:hypothetical protein
MNKMSEWLNENPKFGEQFESINEKIFENCNHIFFNDFLKFDVIDLR